ncbi:MAG: hypothetical protein Q8M07_04985 [Prosthecobacter sp.]|nr:hypothetical protein [Prosthecobacter sp.]
MSAGSQLSRIKGMPRLLQQIRQYPVFLQSQTVALVHKNTRALVSSSGTVPGLVQVSPPHSQGVRGRRAKEQGMMAITADLLGFRGGGGRRTAGVFVVMADDLLAKNAQINATGTVRLFVKKNGDVYGCDQVMFKPRASIAEMHAHHKSLRRKDGRVSEAGGKTRDIGRWKFITQMVVSRSAYLRYERWIHKRVGMLAAAVVAAYNGKYGPLRGVPAWVARHTQSWANGSMTERESFRRGLVITLSIDAGALNGEMQRRFTYVLGYRIKAMEREAPYAIRAAAKSAGLLQ